MGPLNAPSSAGGPEGLGSPVPDDGEQTWVFDPNAVHVYELSLDAERWAALQRDARDEQYTEADLVAAGRSLGRVGLRFKGSLGTLASCFADDGTPRCEKLSMKLKFDEYVIEGWIDEIEAQLGPEVLTDARGPDPSTFEAAVGRLRDSVEGLRQRAELERNARQ